MEEDFPQAQTGISAGYDLNAQLAKQRAHLQADNAYRASGQLSGSVRSGAQTYAGNTPAAQTVSERLQSRLERALSATSRISNTLHEKHMSLFGSPPPGGVSELRKSPNDASGPPSFEAVMTMALDTLNERLSDVEAAAESISTRL